MSLNLISKYLFLEQKAQSLEEVLTFLTKAGGSIHIFSESTHIEALIKPCKMMKIKKKSYLYNPTGDGELVRGCVTGIISELRTCQTLLWLFFPALLWVQGRIVF